jgi:hypothetical protein
MLTTLPAVLAALATLAAVAAALLAVTAWFLLLLAGFLAAAALLPRLRIVLLLARILVGILVRHHRLLELSSSCWEDSLPRRGQRQKMNEVASGTRNNLRIERANSSRNCRQFDLPKIAAVSAVPQFSQAYCVAHVLERRTGLHIETRACPSLAR